MPKLVLYEKDDRDFEKLLDAQVDITNRVPGAHLELKVSNGGVAWVNFQGVCVFRVCALKSENIEIVDERT